MDAASARGAAVRLPGHDLDHPCPPIAQRMVGIEPLVPQAVADQHMHAERRRTAPISFGRTLQ